MKCEEVGKRTRKTIVRRVEKMIDKYGLAETRVIINKYFRDLDEKSRLEKVIKEKEDELNKLKKKK